ncbi:hypothetical protein WDU94_007381 [Cyamophila willieti]
MWKMMPKLKDLGMKKLWKYSLKMLKLWHKSTSLERKHGLICVIVVNPFNQQSIVNIVSLALLVLSVLVLIVSQLSVWLWLLLVICAMGSVAINVWDNYCRHFEIYYRIQYVLSKLRECIHYEWNESSYPHLYMPFSPCINLQWTYRAGHVVNVPWSLLVRGDFILLRPGQPAPAYCTRYQVR